MSRPKWIIVCADDFAFNESVDEGVLRLIAAGRLSAVSCMTDSPLWRAAGARLRDAAASVALGVHFNLIEPFGHGERPLAEWIARSLVGAIDSASVRGHLERQIEQFAGVIGRLPDFIDGHQHVHAFPVLRAVVRDVAVGLEPQRALRIRAVDRFFGRTDAPLKRWVIRRLALAGRPAGDPSLRMNTAFAGDYSLAAEADFAGLMADWVAAAPSGSLIMCHPAAAAGGAGPRELQFLLSDRFRELLAQHSAALETRARPVPEWGASYAQEP